MKKDFDELVPVIKERNEIAHKQFGEPLLTTEQIYSELEIAYTYFKKDFQFGVN